MSDMQDKLSAPPGFDGPVKDRKCTDIIFTLAIIVMWISMTAVGISSVKEVRRHTGRRVTSSSCCVHAM